MEKHKLQALLTTRANKLKDWDNLSELEQRYWFNKDFVIESYEASIRGIEDLKNGNYITLSELIEKMDIKPCYGCSPEKECTCGCK